MQNLCSIQQGQCVCEKEYVAETKEILGIYTKEHQTATRRGETEKPAIADHAKDKPKQHHPVWEAASVMEKVKKFDILWSRMHLHHSGEKQQPLNRDWDKTISDFCSY